MGAEWTSLGFDDAVKSIARPTIAIAASEYLPSGRWPIVDQGKALVAGYTNDSEAVVRQGLPIIVFGDHTRELKYVDFPFAVGADGTKLLVPREPHRLTTRFLYYALRARPLKSLGYSRHFKLLREQDVAFPPDIAEQNRIADVLKQCDDSVVAAERAVAMARRLLEVFRESSVRGGNRRREGAVRTAWGAVPVGWTTRVFGNATTRIARPVSVDAEALYTEIGVRSFGKGVFHKERLTGASLGNKRVFWVEPGCLVLNIVFAWEGAVATTSQREAGLIASHRFPMFQPKADLLLGYLRALFQVRNGVEVLGRHSPGGAGRNKTLNLGALEKTLIPMPPLEEQRRIVEGIEALEKTLEQQRVALDRARQVRDAAIVRLAGSSSVKIECAA